MLFDELSSERSRRGDRRRTGRRGGPVLWARAGGRSDTVYRRVAAALALLAAIAGATWLLAQGLRQTGRAMFASNALFTLRKLDLVSDGRLSPDLIREYARVRSGQNLFDVDLRETRAALEAVPLVREAIVTRHLPDGLSIRVTERTPLARVTMPGTGLTLAVDREGHVLGPGSASPALPAIGGLSEPGLRPGARLSDPKAVEALALLDMCDRTRLCQYVPIRQVDVADPEQMLLTLANGDEAPMPRKDLEAKTRRLASILGTLKSHRPSEAHRARIDLTSDANSSVTWIPR